MDVWNCALGFMDAQVLMTAEEIGVFAALGEEALATEEVAGRVGLPPDGADRLLTALAALGLVHRDAKGRWSNGADALDKLVPGRPGYIGGMFRHLRHELYPLWMHLGDALRDGGAQWRRAFDGGPAPTESMYEDPERLSAFMDGMHAITHRAGLEVADKVPELADCHRIVDIGGAAGSFLIALAERHDGFRGTVFDLPAVRPVAEAFLARYAMAGRLDFHAGDFWEEPLPAGADAYCLGFILHDWDDKGAVRLLEKIAAAAAPGAMLLVGEYLLDDDRTGPLFVARQDLNMLVAARGRERTAPEYARWLDGFGFTLLRIEPTSEGKHFMIFRRR